MGGNIFTPEMVLEKPAAYSCLAGCGYDPKQLKKPLIAVVFTQNDVCPGHQKVAELAHTVGEGIIEEGGTPIYMNAGLGICDGIAMGHPGMNSSLPSREQNRDDVISMVMAHGIFKGVIYVAACDKNIPGYMMAAAFMKDKPGIIVTAGPMLPGYIDGKPCDVVTSFKAEAPYKKGIMTPEQYDEIRMESCSGPGTCRGMFTANTMACMAEALGWTVPGMATAHAVYNNKKRLARESGREVMRMYKEGRTLGHSISLEAFLNAIRVDMALGGSTNTALHIPAIARQAKYKISLDDFQKANEEVCTLAVFSPASELGMLDFEHAGGVPLLMHRMGDLLDTKVMTVTGTLEDRLAAVKDNGATDVIRTRDNPHSQTGGIAVYRGNLAIEGSVIKESAVSPDFPREFRGRARVFDREADAKKHIIEDAIDGNEVAVIRYQGMAGAPGMPELLEATSAVASLGLSNKMALITDGRFSGGTQGPCIGHIEPEAFNRGLIALVEDGDEIVVDMNKREVNLLVSEEEKGRRRAKWKPVVKPALTPRLEEYRRQHTKRVS